MTVFITIKIYNLCKLFCVRRNHYACQDCGARPAGACTRRLAEPDRAAAGKRKCQMGRYARQLCARADSVNGAYCRVAGAVRAGVSGGHGVWFRRRTVPRRLCAGLLCGVRRSDRHAARRRLLPDVSDGVFSAQPSVCADALVSAGRFRGGLHTDAAGAVPAHGRPVAAAGVQNGAVFAAVRRVGLRIRRSAARAGAAHGQCGDLPQRFDRVFAGVPAHGREQSAAV